MRPVALDGCSVDNEAVVPLGKIVRVEVTIDAVPGRMNEIKAERKGMYYGQFSGRTNIPSFAARTIPIYGLLFVA
jgi:cytochrome c oxidase subunit 2